MHHGSGRAHQHLTEFAVFRVCGVPMILNGWGVVGLVPRFCWVIIDVQVFVPENLDKFGDHPPPPPPKSSVLLLLHDLPDLDASRDSDATSKTTQKGPLSTVVIAAATVLLAASTSSFLAPGTL